MREEEEPSWFARWEEQLPSPEELMPLSQTLITPDLAVAFDIPISAAHSPAAALSLHHPGPPPPPPPPTSDPDSSDLNSASAAASAPGADEPARTLKRPRLVWTPQLHKRFVDAVAHLGIKNAVPKTIMQLMSVDGLTRENVASHLQKYRLYLKRVQMQGLNTSSPSPVPSQRFLCPTPMAAPPAEPCLPYVPVAVLQQQNQYYHQTHLGHFARIGPGILSRSVQPQPAMHRTAGLAPGIGLMPAPSHSAAPFANDPGWSGRGEGGSGGGARRTELTLFPTREE